MCYNQGMSIVVFYIFASVFLVSLVSVVGIFFLFLKERVLKEFSFILLSLAVGSLLGGAFFHLFPEIFEKNSEEVPFFILAGIFSFFLLEKILHWHHDHKVHNIQNSKEKCDGCRNFMEEESNKKHLGFMVIFSDALHNALDGMLIAISYLADPVAGVATTVAVLLHEIPQEIGDFGVLIHAGFSKTRAVLFNFMSALTAFVGAGFILFFNEYAQDKTRLLSAFAAGSLLYIAMSDLVPELHKQKKFSHITQQLFAISIGLAAIYALTLFE